MQAVIVILQIVVGIVIVIKGADWLTGGATTLARRMGMPEIVIGLTIVAAGTSMPEFFVSLMSAINHTPDLAVGNVVGSNIFNALLIVGVSAMVCPMAILKSTVRKDIPFGIAASVLLIVLCLDKNISRIDAAILMVGFIIFMWFTLRSSKEQPAEEAEAATEEQSSVWKSLGLIVVGLAGLVVGSKMFVSGATTVATALGVSEAVIGLTIVAGGTSLPELATSVVAARKGNSGIAIGNVLGSNVFNILMILGLTGLICPMQMEGITMIDLGVMLLSMLLLWLFSRTKYAIERWEGALLVVAFAAYLTWLLINV